MAVVLTGMGVQSPLGCTVAECLDNVAKGTRRLAEIENFDTTGFPMKAGGEIRSNGQVVRTTPEMDRKIYFLDKALSQLDAATNFRGRFAPSDILLNVGSGVDHLDIEAFYDNKEYLKPPFSKIDAHCKTKALIKETALRYQITGGCNVFVAACVASTQAMGLSYRMLRKNLCKAVVTGGSESLMDQMQYMGFFLLGAMSSGFEASVACKPFDRRRNGTVLGEGTLMMLLEHSDSANEEDILAEICGYGSTMDAFAITDPDPSGARLAKAIEMAIADAGISPDDIDCAHLHGTGTPKNAPAEYLAMKQVFGARASEIPVYSMKGQMGHMIGSCGAMEMLGVLYSLEHQVVLPTINFSEPDPEAPLRVITGAPLHLPVRYVLKLNSAFGGENTAFIIRKWER